MARFIHSSRHIKKASEDRPVRAVWQAFFESRPTDLSVDAHKEKGVDIDWQVGKDIQINRKAEHYYGAADVSVQQANALGLDVVPRPVKKPFNHPNHAEITGISQEKEVRIAYAKELADVSTFFPVPSDIKKPSFFSPATQASLQPKELTHHC